MPEEIESKSAEQPAQKSTSNNHWLLSTAGLAILSIIFGLLLPPLGLILAVWAIYKAGKSSNKIAATLAVLGVIAVIAGSGFYWWVYDRQNNKTSTTTTYQYTKYDDYKLAGVTKGRGLTFKKPSSFDPSIYGNNSATTASLIQKVKLPNYSNLVTVGSIDIAMATPVQKIDSTYLKKANDAFNQQNSDYIAYQKALTNYLRTNVYPVESNTLTLSSPKAYKSDNIKSNAWLTDYTVKTTYDDGTVRDVTGQLLYAIGTKDFYYFSVSSLSDNFKANTNTWKTVFDSVKIDQ